MFVVKYRGVQRFKDLSLNFIKHFRLKYVGITELHTPALRNLLCRVQLDRSCEKWSVTMSEIGDKYRTCKEEGRLTGLATAWLSTAF